MKQYILLILFCLVIFLYLLLRSRNVEHFQQGSNMKRKVYQKDAVSHNNQYYDQILLMLKN